MHFMCVVVQCFSRLFLFNTIGNSRAGSVSKTITRMFGCPPLFATSKLWLPQEAIWLVIDVWYATRIAVLIYVLFPQLWCYFLTPQFMATPQQRCGVVCLASKVQIGPYIFNICSFSLIAVCNHVAYPFFVCEK